MVHHHIVSYHTMEYDSMVFRAARVTSSSERRCQELKKRHETKAALKESAGKPSMSERVMRSAA